MARITDKCLVLPDKLPTQQIYAQTHALIVKATGV